MGQTSEESGCGDETRTDAGGRADVEWWMLFGTIHSSVIQVRGVGTVKTGVFRRIVPRYSLEVV